MTEVETGPTKPDLAHKCYQSVECIKTFTLHDIVQNWDGFNQDPNILPIL